MINDENMTDITIFGTAASRSYRTHWMAIEAGIEYEHEPIDHTKGEANAPDYLALNPNGQIPTLRDGDFVLWQSFAINLYLARKYPCPVSPKNFEEEMLAVQWSLWAMVEIEAFAVELVHELAKPTADQSAEVNEYFRQALLKPLAVLDGVLADRKHLIADRFTVADLNTAASLRSFERTDMDITPYANAYAWYQDSFSRPAAQEALALQQRDRTKR